MFIGNTTGVKELEVISIEIDGKPSNTASKGDVVGVKLNEQVRENDQVYMMVPVEDVEHLKQ